MAKKLALVTGLHNIFGTTTTNSVTSYQLNNFLSDEVNSNTIVFATADSNDFGNYLGSQLVNAGERYIITQNSIYSLCSIVNPDEDTITESVKWRPIYINGDELLDGSTFDSNSLNFIDGDYITANSYFDNNALSVKFDINYDELVAAIKEGLEIQGVNDGKLTFTVPTESVYSGFDTDNVSYISPNTISVQGEFTANASTDTTINIKYSGNADRVDWYVTNDKRTDDHPNTSDAKKYVYAEPLQDFFNPANFPSVESIKEDKRSIISQDSIVFITCGEKTIDGQSTTLKDQDVFKNPEYRKGSRWIWTQEKMYSANTWGPIFTKDANSQLNEVTPTVGNGKGMSLVFEGTGGIVVDNTINDTTCTISIDGSGIVGTGSSGRVYDTDVYVKKDIKIANTGLAKLVLADGTFADTNNVVPAGMTLHEVLERLLYMAIKEEWPKVTEGNYITTYSPTITISAQDSTGKNVANNGSVVVGEKLTITASINNGTPKLIKTISGFNSTTGYKIGDKTYTGTSYTYTANNNITNAAITAKNITFEDNGSSIYSVVANDNLTNTITFSNTNIISAAQFDDVSVYALSNLGNPNTTPTIIKYTGWNTTTKNAEATFKINVLLPHYIGYSNEVIEFWSTTLSDEEKAQKLLALANLETKTNKISTGSQDKTTEYDVEKFEILQLIVAIPKAYFSNITDDVYFSIKDNTFQTEWYDINSAKTNTHSLNEITLHGTKYIVWTMYHKLGANYNGQTYTITYK